MEYGNIETVELDELAKRFDLPHLVTLDTVRNYGNTIRTKLLCEICGKTSIPMVMFEELIKIDNEFQGLALSSEEVFKQAHTHIPFDSDPRVYFLIEDGEIVYIGQTCCICARIATHAGAVDGVKKFDKVTTISVKRELLKITETVNIRKYKPRLNRDIMSNENYLKEVLKSSSLADF
jgi:hypothetical protein